jgi:hypothetical protein
VDAFPLNLESHARRVALALAGAVALASAAATPAQAAMNFCAAPALQSSERTHADPGVKALVADAQAHLNDPPHALPQLRTAHAPPHPNADDASTVAEKDFELMRNAALAWRATGDDRYLKFVDRTLAAWVKTYQPSFNPIDETRLDGLILAYDMTGSALPVATRNATIAFLRKLANGYVADIDAQTRPLNSSFSNTLQSHRVKLIAMAAFTLDDRKLINVAQQLFIAQIGANIDKNGAPLDFAERDAMRDVTHDLQPLVMAALAARRHNRNWLRVKSPSGATLQGALDWLAPYATGDKTHEEFVPATAPSDPARSATGLPGFNGDWTPQDAAELFYLAARLDARYQPIALRLTPAPPPWLAVCLPLPAR